jgi:hypothetical protein
MLYTPSRVAGMWDTWCFYHQGVHYLFYIHRTTPEEIFDGISLAVSADGVHWEEKGEIIHKLKDAESIGSGSVWKVGGRFVMNFSETRRGVQAIFFAVSDDLMHWTRLGSEYCFCPDPRWYRVDRTGRWDGIWAVSNSDGSYTGFFTAVPKTGALGVQESIGMAHSNDGVKWEAMAPPAFDWGNWGNLRTWEVGAVEKIGSRYWMLMGANESVLGCRVSAGGSRKEEIGMFVYSSENMNGPFRAEPGCWRFLTGPCDRFLMAYFARFYRVPDKVLVNHHSIEPQLEGKLLVFARSWMAPLKVAMLTENGCLVPGYWEGNESLKGNESHLVFEGASLWPEYALACNIRRGHDFLELTQPNAGGVAMAGKHFDIQRGIIIEGLVTIYKMHKAWASAGIVVETEEKTKGTIILMNDSGIIEIGDILAALPEDPSITRIIRYVTRQFEIPAGTPIKFRVLLRHCFVELYINDICIQCYTMSEMPTGRIGWAVESGKVVFSSVKIWEMTV